MRNINRVILAGNLTRDPEFRQLPSNTPVASFGLAVNRRWKHRETGEVQEEVTFVDCETFGRSAEVLRDYGRKGRGLFIEGRLQLDQWQDREGHQRSKLKVVVDNFQFTDRPGSGEAEGGEAGGEGGAKPRRVEPTEDLLPF